MGARRASASAVVAVVGGVLLITLLVAWAASIGPERGAPRRRTDRGAPARQPDDVHRPPAPRADPLENLGRERTHRARQPASSRCSPSCSSCCWSVASCSVLVSRARLAWQTRRELGRPDATVRGRSSSTSWTARTCSTRELSERRRRPARRCSPPVRRATRSSRCGTGSRPWPANVGAARRPVGDVVRVHAPGARGRGRRLVRGRAARRALPRGTVLRPRADRGAPGRGRGGARGHPCRAHRRTPGGADREPPPVARRCGPVGAAVGAVRRAARCSTSTRTRSG